MKTKPSKHYLFIPVILLLLLIAACEWMKLDPVNFIMVETGPPTDIVFDPTDSYIKSVVLSGSVEGLEIGRFADVGHIWSTTAMELTVEAGTPISLGEKIENGPILSPLNNLIPNTTYYYRAYAIQDGRIFYGDPADFSTSMLGFQVVIDSVEKYTAAIQPFGHIEGLQAGVALNNHGFVWSTEHPLPTVESDTVTAIGRLINETHFQRKIEGIEGEWPQKSYYVRAFATLGDSTIYSRNVIEFKKGDIWVQKDPAPIAMQGSYVFTYQDKAYIGGGRGINGYNLEFYRFDPSVEVQWLSLRQMPNSSYVHLGAAFALTISDGGYGYVGLGISASNNNRDLLLYDIQDNRWDKLENSVNPGLGGRARIDAHGFSMQNEGYLAFGSGSPCCSPTYDILKFSPGPNPKPTEIKQNQIPFSPKRNVGVYEGIVFSLRDSILFAGLDGGFFGTANNQLWRYKGGNVWTKVASLPPGFHANDLHTFSIGDRGFVITNDAVENLWEYNARRDQWTPRRSFPQNPIRSNTVSFSLNDRGYYGLGQGGNIYNDLWEYIPEEE
ncbi:MAG: hypothetical protein R2824_26475 [Saprospiraceae bacterium]|nr:hypothetical protein [Lewinella sp.]